MDYTNEQITEILDGYFREDRRPEPFADIAARLKVGYKSSPHNALQRVVWGAVTGYPTGTPRANKRRAAPVWPEGLEHYRAGWTWYPREDKALHHGLRGKGQERKPPVDIAYLAQVLARTEKEVADRWQLITADKLERKGFGFE